MKDVYALNDKFDQELVGLLREDGRISFTDMAKILGVSVSTVRNRYNKLVDDKVLHILGWVDPTRTGFNSYNRITIDVRPSGLIESVAQQLTMVEEVSFLALTSGGADIEINLICKDHHHYQQVIREKIHSIEGVYNTSSTIYYQVYKWAAHNIYEEREINSDAS